MKLIQDYNMTYNTKFHNGELHDKSFLVTGGAGFIGSNLVEYLLEYGAKRVRVLDNFATGFRHNLAPFIGNPSFELIEGDIRKLEDCENAVNGIDYVFHEAALGSVPRSINDPITTNDVNVSGFLNMLQASKNGGVKRFVYAASSSTYGDSASLPKVENVIGNPLSPYAITKYVNELYAGIFSSTYGLETIGLRYFNVFGRRQDPKGAYAAVIPKFVMQLMDHQSPVINGDGEFSRDFTYIDNVIQMNILAMLSVDENAKNTVYNTAVGERTTLNDLTKFLKKFLGEFDSKISDIKIIHGMNRIGDIPHSLASIEKAERLLGYAPSHNLQTGLKEAVVWYWDNLRNK